MQIRGMFVFGVKETTTTTNDSPRKLPNVAFQHLLFLSLVRRNEAALLKVGSLGRASRLC